MLWLRASGLHGWFVLKSRSCLKVRKIQEGSDSAGVFTLAPWSYETSTTRVETFVELTTSPGLYLQVSSAIVVQASPQTLNPKPKFLQLGTD